MATLISIATGNFTTAGTWGLVDSTSYLDSEVGGSVNGTTSYVYSSTFTPGAITVDGIAVKVGGAASSGTVSIELFNNTDAVSVTSVTINTADVAQTLAATTYNHGWHFFKFSASQTLIAGKAYKVGFKVSVASQVALYRDATAGNWARMLRTTTTQAPAAGDQLHVIGELTGAGTGNSFTVTMDNTASTSFGPTVSGGPPQGITVGKRGTWLNGIVASTNYVFKWKGVFAVTDGGTLTIGTHTDPIPASSSVDYIMDSVANVDTGFDFGNGATVTINGDEKFTTTFKTLLNTDEAAAQTVLGMTSTTGWANGDEIVIASTSQTASQCERRTISTVDSSTQVTVSAGLTNAHSGTSPTQAEVGNITRNLKIHGIGTNAPSTTTTLQGYINCAATSSVTIKYAQLYYLGSATTSKRGIDVATTTGTFNMQYCSIHDFCIQSSLGVSTSGTSGGVTFSNNVMFNIASTNFTVAATTGAHVVTNNLFMLQVQNQSAVNILDAGSTVTDNIIVGMSGIGFAINESSVLGTFSNNTVHSCSGVSFAITNVRGGTITNMTVWRGFTFGMTMSAASNLVFEAPVFFGNTTANIQQAAGGQSSNITFNNLVSNGDTTFATTSGVQLNDAAAWILNSADFSTVGGIKTAHSNDILINLASESCGIVLMNSKMGGTNEVASQTNMHAQSFVGSQRHETTAGLHKSWFVGGTLTIDTTIFNTASPSARLTPLSASVKMVSATIGRGFKKVVASGATLAASIYVRKSVVGDGAAYNGNQPRLIVRKNVAAGISADTVLATASAAAGSWEQLSGTTAAVTDDAVLEFYVDADGTTGWINIDDFA